MYISPSMICMDLCNIESSVLELEQAGCNMLHVDVLDGYFSPSMPIGLEQIKQLRKKTNIMFDAHVMTKENTFFINELLDIGVERLCFQIETEVHVSRKLSLIRSKGVKAGVALAPSTPISTLEYVLEQCDFVLLMMINPGYASNSSEGVLAECVRKIENLHNMIKNKNLNTTITIDGRVSKESIPKYIELGADTFVAGTSSLFLNNEKSVKENFEQLSKLLKKD